MKNYLKLIQLYICPVYIMTLIYCLTESISPSKGQSSEELRQRFLQEAPPLWKEYHARIEQFDGTVTGKWYVENKLEDHYRFEYKHNASCRLCLTQSLLPHEPSGSVCSYNTKYSFILTRRSLDHPWVLRGYHWRQEGETIPEMKELHDIELKPLSRLIRADTSDLVKLVNRKTFRVLRVVSLQQGNEELVRIEFDNSHEPAFRSTKDFEPIQSGVLLLDPRRYWCLRGCELSSKYSNADAKIRMEVELQERFDDFPVPRRITVTSQQVREGNERLRTVWETEYDLYEPSRFPPEEEFTLSAFGLPEPVGVAWERPVRWYVWLVVVGVACLLAGGVFYGLSRRRTI
jgi:hypothetical protein